MIRSQQGKRKNQVIGRSRFQVSNQRRTREHNVSYVYQEEYPTEISRHIHAHPQYAGLEHCAKMITSREKQQGRRFDFGVRMRYDLFFKSKSPTFNSFAQSVIKWPIWGPRQNNINILTFQKHDLAGASRRCLPQDVIFVTRKFMPSVAWLFQGDHSVYKDHICHNGRDKYEATLFDVAFKIGARIATLEKCAHNKCWELRNNRSRHELSWNSYVGYAHVFEHC